MCNQGWHFRGWQISNNWFLLPTFKHSFFAIHLMLWAAFDWPRHLEKASAIPFQLKCRLSGVVVEFLKCFEHYLQIIVKGWCCYSQHFCFCSFKLSNRKKANMNEWHIQEDSRKQRLAGRIIQQMGKVKQVQKNGRLTLAGPSNSFHPHHYHYHY